jgi:hypothetical protein
MKILFFTQLSPTGICAHRPFPDWLTTTALLLACSPSIVDLSLLGSWISLLFGGLQSIVLITLIIKLFQIWQGSLPNWCCPPRQAPVLLGLTPPRTARHCSSCALLGPGQRAFLWNAPIQCISSSIYFTASWDLGVLELLFTCPWERRPHDHLMSDFIYDTWRTFTDNIDLPCK